MTISSELTNLENTKSAIKQAIINKGVSVGEDDGFASYATKIGQISSGATLVTKNITQNGTYNASSDNADGYSSVTVNVSGGSDIGVPREVSANGTFQMPSSNFTFSLPNNVTDIGVRALSHAFSNSTNLTSVDLSNLTTISGTYAISNAFQNCKNLISVDLSGLTTISGTYGLYQSFQGCTKLTSVDLSSLTTLAENSMFSAFQNCTKLTSIALSSLTTISGSSALSSAFNGCTGLTSVDLSNLTTISGSTPMNSTFKGCTGLTSVDLSSLTTVSGDRAMEDTFRNCTNLTSVLFTNLETIGLNASSMNNSHFSQCFNGCTNLTSITFPKLKSIYCTGSTSTSYGTFANNNKVQKMYFPKLDTITYGTGASSSNRNACKNVFYGCSALTELHFGAANQAAIEATAGYSTAWGRGAGNVTIYFDL